MNIDGNAINALLWVLVICVVGYACFWVIDRIGIPAQFVWIARVIVGIILLFALLSVIGVLPAVTVTALGTATLLS